MNTGTQTKTYTVTDIRRVVASFAADFSMISQATGLRARDDVAETVLDLCAFAEAGYLLKAHLILWDANGNKMRAAEYTVSTAAVGWTNDRPGNNLWPRTTGGRLQVIATLSDEWWEMDEAAKARVREQWGIIGTWSLTNVDTSHADMTARIDRRYAHSSKIPVC